MTSTLLTAIFLTLFSHTAWAITDRKFSAAFSEAKLDVAALTILDLCQSQVRRDSTSRQCLRADPLG
jgi:hypothetical protein